MNCFLSKNFVLSLFVYLWIAVSSAKFWIFCLLLLQNASRVVSKQKERKQMWFSHSLRQILTKEKEKRFRVNWKVNLKVGKASGTVCVSDDNLIPASTFQLWLPNIAYHSVTLRKPTRRRKRKHSPDPWEECSAYMKIVISDGRTFFVFKGCVEFRLSLPPLLFQCKSISGNLFADSTTPNPFIHVSYYLIKTSGAFCLQQTHQASTTLFSCFSIPLSGRSQAENTQAVAWTYKLFRVLQEWWRLLTDVLSR